MTLATSCPSCGTVFKVIEDQLKVSEGWVRCGHCHSVFNALEGLFDLGARPRSGQTRPMTEGLASGSGVLQETPEMAPSVATGMSAAAASSVPEASLRAPRSAVATSGLAAPSGFGAVDPDDVDARPKAFAPPPVSHERQDPQGTHEAVKGDAVKDEAVMVMPAPEDTVHERHELLADGGRSRRHPDFSDADTVFLAHDPQGSLDLGLMADRPGEGEPSTPSRPHALEPRFDDDTAVPPSGAGGFDASSDAGAAQMAQMAHGAHSGDPSASTDQTGHSSDPVVAALDAADPAGWNDLDPAPSFVRHADRAAWWSRPAVRVTLMIGCLLAAAGALLQVGVMRRDLLAARSPLAAAVLLPVCEVIGCTIDPPHLLDALTVENSNMVKLTGVDGYRLQVLLRNRADHVVRAPSVELSLTDATGALVVRRVLQPSDFQQAELLAAGAEGNWQLEFASSDRRVAGYTVAIFYP